MTGNKFDGTLSYSEGARRAAPVGVAVLVDGLAFGVVATGLGIAPAATVAMSALVFSGTAQFTALGVLGSGGGVLPATLAAVLTGARSVPMGLAVGPVLGGGRVWRALSAQLVVDESWAIGQVGPGRWDARLLVGAGLVIWVTWLAGTTLGVVGAGAIDEPQELGLDAAFPALFLALLAPQLRSSRAATASVASGLLVLALMPIAPPGVPILAASVVCLAGLARR
jgi:predicted branched-subunit amino acid permease